MEYETIEEIVVVAQPYQVNHLLAHGYKLLGIQGTTEGRVNEKGGWWVRRRPVFVVGRPAGVAVAPATPSMAAPVQKQPAAAAT